LRSATFQVSIRIALFAMRCTDWCDMSIINPRRWLAKKSFSLERRIVSVWWTWPSYEVNLTVWQVSGRQCHHVCAIHGW
jgi:hypothetical protein